MKKLSLLALLLVISACSMHHAAPVIRAESLVSSSNEKISFPITDPSSVPAIENWISNGDLPSGAELTCVSDGGACNSVKNLLSRHKIAYNEVPATPDASTGSIALTYNRIIARDCTTNNFGCATSINSIHMVTNREQFIKPVISDYQDAAGAVKAVNQYVK